MSMPAEHMSMNPTLAELLQGFAGAPAIPIRGIASDSRLLKAGDLFLACDGDNSHGVEYIGDAVTAGVAAIAWDSSTTTAPANAEGVPMVAVPGLAQHLGPVYTAG